MTRILSFAVLAALICGCGAPQMADKNPSKADSPVTAKKAETPAIASPADKFIARFESLLEKDPKNVDALIGLGSAQLQKGRETGQLGFYVEGRDTLQQAADLHPNNSTAWQALGYSMTIFHRFGKAIEYSKKAIELNKDDFRAYGVLTDSYLEVGDYEKATETCQKMVDLRPDLASFSRGARIRQIYGDNRGAQLLYQQALNCGSPFAENTAWVRTMMAEVSFKSGAIRAAEQQYGRALKDLPDYRHAQMGLGRVRWAQGKHEEAVKLMEVGCAGDAPIPYLADLGDLYAAMGYKEKAEATYKRIEDTVASYKEHGIQGHEIQLATFWLDHDRNIGEAFEIAEHEADHHATIEAQTAHAWACHKTGRKEEAVRAIEKAMRTRVQDSLVFYRASEIYKAAGKSQEAQKLAIAAQNLNPNFSILFSSKAKTVAMK